MDTTRRAMLGAAALGAGGLALVRAAAAAEGNDHGKPGEGGYGREAVQLDRDLLDVAQTAGADELRGLTEGLVE